MHPLWKVMNFTWEFKFCGELWRISCGSDHEDGSIAVIHKESGIPTKFNPYCLVEPVGIDMGAGQPA